MPDSIDFLKLEHSDSRRLEKKKSNKVVPIVEFEKSGSALCRSVVRMPSIDEEAEVPSNTSN